MKEIKKNVNEEEVLEDQKKREFLDKFGKLAATVPVGMLFLMGPTQSKAQGSPSDGS